jgi:hypothetical protein
VIVYIATLSLGLALYALVGNSLVRGIYENKAGILSGLIQANTTKPLDYFYNRADEYVFVASYWLILGLAAITCVRLIARNRLTKAIAFNAILVSLIYEVFVLLIMDRPGLISQLPNGLITHLRNVYGNNRDLLPLIQSENYDPLLSYTLEPGSIHHREREFDIIYEINSQFLRDDEPSLHSPVIIVLGDSHAMGFGVGQDKTFAQIIERRTGMKVLNAAVHSYGTVREMRLLDRLDTNGVKYLIIQYCNNDYYENSLFLKNGDLKISSFEEHARKVDMYVDAKGYYIGKYAAQLIGRAATRIRHSGSELFFQLFPNKVWPEEIDHSREAKAFLNALAYAGNKRLNNARVIVLAVSPKWDIDPRFIENVDALKQSSKYPDFVRNLIVVRLASKLTEEHFFVLDDHINARGHDFIANEILDALERLP